MQNYVNGIPSSLLGYGSQRLQFQTYNGVFSGNEANPRARRVETLQKRILFLEDKYNTLLALTSIFNNQVEKTLNIPTLKCKFFSATTSAVSNETNKTLVNHSVEGTGISMNDRMIQCRASGDTNHIIQRQADPASGFDGLEVRGNRGGRLRYMKDATPTTCMEWGSERIRSHKTFQAGIETKSTTGLITVNFETVFKSTPVVITSFRNDLGIETRRVWDYKTRTVYQNNVPVYIQYLDVTKSGPIQFFIQIISVSTSGFTCKLMSHWKNTSDSPNEVEIRTEPYKGSGQFVDFVSSGGNIISYLQSGIQSVTFSWQAFDPTNTNIYTT